MIVACNILTGNVFILTGLEVGGSEEVQGTNAFSYITLQSKASANLPPVKLLFSVIRISRLSAGFWNDLQFLKNLEISVHHLVKQYREGKICKYFTTYPIY